MIKLAFSTLGCPDWDWSEIYSTAKDLRFDGIEVRGVANELFVPKIKAFDETHIEKNMTKMKSCGLEFSMLTSGISIGEDNKTALEDAKTYIDLASKLSANYVRIMISSHPQPEEVNMETAMKLYNEMCQYGEDKG
ncbi:MAG: sugar phosphate isomerase/epimerase, partial [Oscillospiraceae bacterium]